MGRPVGAAVFLSRVKEARDALRERAKDLIDMQIAIIQEARIAGDFETASKATQWLLAHIKDEDGTSIVEADVDKPAQIEGSNGPTIQIGFQLGGMKPQKQLEEPAIEVVPLDPVSNPTDKENE